MQVTLRMFSPRNAFVALYADGYKEIIGQIKYPNERSMYFSGHSPRFQSPESLTDLLSSMILSGIKITVFDTEHGARRALAHNLVTLDHSPMILERVNSFTEFSETDFSTMRACDENKKRILLSPGMDTRSYALERLTNDLPVFVSEYEDDCESRRVVEKASLPISPSIVFINNGLEDIPLRSFTFDIGATNRYGTDLGLNTAYFAAQQGFSVWSVVEGRRSDITKDVVWEFESNIPVECITDENLAVSDDTGAPVVVVRNADGTFKTNSDQGEIGFRNSRECAVFHLMLGCDVFAWG